MPMRISGRCDGDGFRVRRFPPRFQVVLVLVLLLAGCSKEPDELVLRCEGSVGSFRSPLWTKDGELIATHVKNGAITFSGNGFLLGEKIKLCPEGTLGISSDTFYFDSSGCSGMSKTKAHPVVPGSPICGMRMPCGGRLRRAREGIEWLRAISVSTVPRGPKGRRTATGMPTSGSRHPKTGNPAPFQIWPATPIC